MHLLRFLPSPESVECLREFDGMTLTWESYTASHKMLVLKAMDSAGNIRRITFQRTAFLQLPRVLQRVQLRIARDADVNALQSAIGACASPPYTRSGVIEINSDEGVFSICCYQVLLGPIGESRDPFFNTLDGQLWWDGPTLREAVTSRWGNSEGE